MDHEQEDIFEKLDLKVTCNRFNKILSDIPKVVIVGHVDHGKVFINRKANV